MECHRSSGSSRDCSGVCCEKLYALSVIPAVHMVQSSMTFFCSHISVKSGSRISAAKVRCALNNSLLSTVVQTRCFSILRPIWKTTFSELFFRYRSPNNKLEIRQIQCIRLTVAARVAALLKTCQINCLVLIPLCPGPRDVNSYIPSSYKAVKIQKNMFH